MTENLPHGNPLARDLDAIVAAMGDGWEAYRGARIFLTGGTGFFGRWFLESFHWANRHHALGATLTVLSRNGDAFAQEVPHLMGDGAIRFHLGDVRHFTFPEGAFTHILHAAAESSGGSAGHDGLHMADTILGGTRRVLDFAQETGARVMCLSSGAVYGRWRADAVPIAEDDRNAPLVTDDAIAYDESKRMAEALGMLYHRERGVPVTVARGFSFVGPHLPRDGHFAIGNFIRDALAGGDIRLSGDGSAVRSYLYMADAMVWLWTLLARGAAGQAYNVGSGEAVSIAQLVQRVQQVLSAKGAVVLGKGSTTNGLLNYQVPDVSRAGALGLTVSVPLDEAIRRTAAWYRDHPEPARGGQAPSVLAKPDVVVFDFDGVMTDNRVIVREDGREAVVCNRSDGLGIGMLKKRGVPMLVLSTEENPVVGARCRKLGLECLQGIAVKEQALARWLAERGYDPARTIYLGNDINDFGCLKLVGLPVVVGDAYDAVKPLARIVLRKHGGKGAVRELADRILAAAGA